MKQYFTPIALAAAALFAAAPIAAHEPDGGGKLGSVQFEVQCNANAQREFNLAAAYYHSFAWEQIKAPLDRALQADSSCGMVHWLRATQPNATIWPGTDPLGLDASASLGS